MILTPHSLLLFALPLVFADVEFTSPAAGAQVPVGNIHVAWQEGGRAPPITDLTEYTLTLMVGGNDAADMFVVQTFKSGGDFSQANAVDGIVAAGAAATVPNGFFFKMQSTSSNGGGYVINYSDRFTITGLTGSTDSTYRNAAEALNGDTNGPPRSGNALISSSSSASVSASSTSTKSAQTVTVTDGSHSSSAPNSSGANGSDSNTGVIAGAVIGSLAFLIAVVGFGIWACFRRKRRQDSSQELDDKDIAIQPSVELAKHQPSVTAKPSITQLSELSAEGRVVEIGDGIPPPEMDSNNVRAELPGDYIHEPTGSPLTPVSPSLYGEETLIPTLPRSGF